MGNGLTRDEFMRYGVRYIGQTFGVLLRIHNGWNGRSISVGLADASPGVLYL